MRQSFCLSGGPITACAPTVRTRSENDLARTYFVVHLLYVTTMMLEDVTHVQVIRNYLGEEILSTFEAYFNIINTKGTLSRFHG